MIPDVFNRIGEIPLTPNGKVDRKALSAIEYTRTEGKAEIIHATRDIERKLLEIWKGVLKLDTISIDDNFFDLGGNSLLIIQVQQQIKQKLEIEIPVTKLFQYTQLKYLADYLNPKNDDTPVESDAQVRSMLKKQALENRKTRQASRRTR